MIARPFLIYRAGTKSPSHEVSQNETKLNIFLCVFVTLWQKKGFSAGLLGAMRRGGEKRNEEEGELSGWRSQREREFGFCSKNVKIFLFSY